MIWGPCNGPISSFFPQGNSFTRSFPGVKLAGAHLAAQGRRRIQHHFFHGAYAGFREGREFCICEIRSLKFRNEAPKNKTGHQLKNLPKF